MRLYAPLLPYAIAFWLGCTFGVGDLNYKWLIFLLWFFGGCWIGFDWSYRFSHARYLLFISCCLIGVSRSFFEINNRPFPDGELHTFSITSCKPLPVCHGGSIYGYGNTREVGKVAFRWPDNIVFPAVETIATGYWNDFSEQRHQNSFDARSYYERLGCRGVFIPKISLNNYLANTSQHN